MAGRVGIGRHGGQPVGVQHVCSTCPVVLSTYLSIKLLPSLATFPECFPLSLARSLVSASTRSVAEVEDCMVGRKCLALLSLGSWVFGLWVGKGREGQREGQRTRRISNQLCFCRGLYVGYEGCVGYMACVGTGGRSDIDDVVCVWMNAMRERSYGSCGELWGAYGVVR